MIFRNILSPNKEYVEIFFFRKRVFRNIIISGESHLEMCFSREITFEIFCVQKKDRFDIFLNGFYRFSWWGWCHYTTCRSRCHHHDGDDDSDVDDNFWYLLALMPIPLLTFSYLACDGTVASTTRPLKHCHINAWRWIEKAPQHCDIIEYWENTTAPSRRNTWFVFVLFSSLQEGDWHTRV